MSSQKADSPSGKGGNGKGPGSPESNEQQVEIEVKMSEQVRSWLPYCGRPLTVHLKFQILLMDWHEEVIDMPVDQHGNTVPVGVTAPALFRHVDDDKREKDPMITDTLERVFMQPAPCGKRLVLSQKTDPALGLSGAVIGYLIDPEDINTVSFVDRMPQRRVAAPSRGLVVPSS